MQAKHDQATAFVASSTAFVQAVSFFDAGNYLQSKPYFEKVKDFDTENYAIAQDRIQEIPLLLADEHLDEAKELYSQKEYIKAFAELGTALKYNPDLEEALKLREGYEKQKIAQEEREKKEAAEKAERERKEAAERAKQTAIETMKKYESGAGPMSVAAQVKITETFNTGYTTYYSKDKKGCFVRVHVNVANSGTGSEHVNPLYFTLSTPGGYIVNTHEAMYSLSNSLDAMDLQPNTYTSGWLVFYAPKADYYMLHFESLSSKVNKKIVW